MVVQERRGSFCFTMVDACFLLQVLIWGRKRYLFNPVLVRDDGPIGKFRKWYNQFYSENSPTWASIQEEKQRLFEISNW
jgi:hypothetical protein